eukprot:6553129-Alexandrium_andersonii.AAC.1
MFYTRKTPVAVSSETLGALAVLQQHSTPSVALNGLAQECALDDAVEAQLLSQLRHLPGISNIMAEAMSRQSAPDTKACPEALASVQRTLVPVRDSSFYPPPAQARST